MFAGKGSTTIAGAAASANTPSAPDQTPSTTTDSSASEARQDLIADFQMLGLMGEGVKTPAGSREDVERGVNEPIQDKNPAAQSVYLPPARAILDEAFAVCSDHAAGRGQIQERAECFARLIKGESHTKAQVENDKGYTIPAGSIKYDDAYMTVPVALRRAADLAGAEAGRAEVEAEKLAAANQAAIDAKAEAASANQAAIVARAEAEQAKAAAADAAKSAPKCEVAADKDTICYGMVKDSAILRDALAGREAFDEKVEQIFTDVKAISDFGEWLARLLLENYEDFLRKLPVEYSAELRSAEEISPLFREAFLARVETAKKEGKLFSLIQKLTGEYIYDVELKDVLPSKITKGDIPKVLFTKESLGIELVDIWPAIQLRRLFAAVAHEYATFDKGGLPPLEADSENAAAVEKGTAQKSKLASALAASVKKLFEETYPNISERTDTNLARLLTNVGVDGISLVGNHAPLSDDKFEVLLVSKPFSTQAYSAQIAAAAEPAPSLPPPEDVVAEERPTIRVVPVPAPEPAPAPAPVESAPVPVELKPTIDPMVSEHCPNCDEDKKVLLSRMCQESKDGKDLLTRFFDSEEDINPRMRALIIDIYDKAIAKLPDDHTAQQEKAVALVLIDHMLTNMEIMKAKDIEPVSDNRQEASLPPVEVAPEPTPVPAPVEPAPVPEPTPAPAPVEAAPAPAPEPASTLAPAPVPPAVPAPVADLGRDEPPPEGARHEPEPRPAEEEKKGDVPAGRTALPPAVPTPVNAQLPAKVDGNSDKDKPTKMKTEGGAMGGMERLGGVKFVDMLGVRAVGLARSGALNSIKPFLDKYSGPEYSEVVHKAIDLFESALAKAVPQKDIDGANAAVEAAKAKVDKKENGAEEALKAATKARDDLLAKEKAATAGIAQAIAQHFEDNVLKKVNEAIKKDEEATKKAEEEEAKKAEKDRKPIPEDGFHTSKDAALEDAKNLARTLLVEKVYEEDCKWVVKIEEAGKHKPLDSYSLSQTFSDGSFQNGKPANVGYGVLNWSNRIDDRSKVTVTLGNVVGSGNADMVTTPGSEFHTAFVDGGFPSLNVLSDLRVTYEKSIGDKNPKEKTNEDDQIIKASAGLHSDLNMGGLAGLQFEYYKKNIGRSKDKDGNITEGPLSIYAKAMVGMPAGVDFNPSAESNFKHGAMVFRGEVGGAYQVTDKDKSNIVVKAGTQVQAPFDMSAPGAKILYRFYGGASATVDRDPFGVKDSQIDVEAKLNYRPFVEGFGETKIGAKAKWSFKHKDGNEHGFETEATYIAYGAVKQSIPASPFSTGASEVVVNNVDMMQFKVGGYYKSGPLIFSGGLMYSLPLGRHPGYGGGPSFSFGIGLDI